MSGLGLSLQLLQLYCIRCHLAIYSLEVVIKAMKALRSITLVQYNYTRQMLTASWGEPECAYAVS